MHVLLFMSLLVSHCFNAGACTSVTLRSSNKYSRLNIDKQHEREHVKIVLYANYAAYARFHFIRQAT